VEDRERGNNLQKFQLAINLKLANALYQADLFHSDSRL